MAFRNDRHPETAPFSFPAATTDTVQTRPLPPRLPLDRLVHSSILQTRERVWPAHAQQPNDRSALSILAGFWAGPGKRYQRIILTVRTELTVQTAQTQRRGCLGERSTKGIGRETSR